VEKDMYILTGWKYVTYKFNLHTCSGIHEQNFETLRSDPSNWLQTLVASSISLALNTLRTTSQIKTQVSRQYERIRTCFDILIGSAMAQAVSSLPLTTGARVHARVSTCGICGEYSGPETGPKNTSRR
jgi:hypothetical protein